MLGESAALSMLPQNGGFSYLHETTFHPILKLAKSPVLFLPQKGHTFRSALFGPFDRGSIPVKVWSGICVTGFGACAIVILASSGLICISTASR
jgi:hypothetical protein